MDIVWYGQSCFKIKGKDATIIIDPFDPEFTGLKLPKDLSADIILKTHDHQDHNFLAPVSGLVDGLKIFDGPGEYESQGVVVTGVASFHDKVQGKERGLNTIYHIYLDGMNVVHLGDLGQASLSEEQVQEIGQSDILILPVGGVYTIDAKEAAGIVVQLEPSLVIPCHYAIEGLKFPLEGVEKFLKEMGEDKVTPQPKLSVTKDKLTEEPQVILLAKSS